MPTRVVFLHTVTSLAGLFTDLARELLPGEVEIVHIADELLLKVILAQNGLSPYAHRRVAEHAAAAEAAGATVLQCTCSSISPCVDSTRPMVGIPILKIDEPMVAQAIKLGSRIGVAATAPTTLRPTSELVQARAVALNRAVRVEPVLCEGAYAALFAGDVAAHDTIVRKVVLDLMDRNEVILLAQASMARLVGSILAERADVPVLSSPRLAVEHLAQVLGEAQT